MGTAGYVIILVFLIAIAGLLVWYFLMKYHNSTRSQRRKYWELSPFIVQRLRGFKRRFSRKLDFSFDTVVTKEFYVGPDLRENKFLIGKWEIGSEGWGEMDSFHASLTIELLGDFSTGEPKYLTLHGYDRMSGKWLSFKTEDLSREGFDSLLNGYSQVIEGWKNIHFELNRKKEENQPQSDGKKLARWFGGFPIKNVIVPTKEDLDLANEVAMNLRRIRKDNSIKSFLYNFKTNEFIGEDEKVFKPKSIDPDKTLIVKKVYTTGKSVRKIVEVIGEPICLGIALAKGIPLIEEMGGFIPEVVSVNINEEYPKKYESIPCDTIMA